MTMNETLQGSGTSPQRTWRDAGRALLDDLLASRLERLAAGRLAVRFPSGRREEFGGQRPGPDASMAIGSYRLLFRVLAAGDMGFAEGYIAGDWDADDLAGALAVFASNREELARARARTRPRRLLDRLYHASRANTRSGSRRNIAAHYDLGNEFYGLWLDPTMSYSSALFSDLSEPHEVAQRRKYLRLARALDLKPGATVLEIGCGWGAFAEIAAAEFGCRVTAVTLSREQAAHARDRIARAGLGDRVDIRVQDYRDIDGRFDRIASIEMFEAVGERNWPTFFSVLDDRLAPGGRAALQVISIADRHFERYRTTPDFIQRYIFPGGMLPSPTAFADAATAAGLTILDDFRFGPSYAETLRRWDAAFVENWAQIGRLGFDRRFFRMWRYYLAYCAVGFDLGLIDVGHRVVARERDAIRIAAVAG